MIRRWFMTGFGLGYSPVASGTAGSAGAVAIALGVWAAVSAADLGNLGLNLSWVALSLLAAAGCVRWGDWAIGYFADKAKKAGDPGQVVLDEFAGQWVALIALPMPSLERTLIVLGVQFFLFRVFDVFKPSPGRQLETLHGGWGIVLDDLAAGVYANLVGQVIFRIVWT